MSVYDGAELTKAGAREWLDRLDWTLEQSVYLLCAIDPKTLNNWASVNGGKVAVSLPDELMAGVRAALLQGIKDGQISFPSLPQSVIDWVMFKGMRLPAPLIPAGCKVKGGKWTQDKPGRAGLPTFEIPVRPYEVPPELLALPPDAWVHCQDGPRPGSRRDIVAPAAELVEIFTALMDRQALGKFTLVEAAQAVAEHGGVDAMQLLKDMKEAAAFENEERRLKVYGWNTKRVRKPSEELSAAADYVMAEDLNEWLDSVGDGLCLPMPEQPRHDAKPNRFPNTAPAVAPETVHTLGHHYRLQFPSDKLSVSVVEAVELTASVMPDSTEKVLLWLNAHWHKKKLLEAIKSGEVIPFVLRTGETPNLEQFDSYQDDARDAWMLTVPQFRKFCEMLRIELVLQEAPTPATVEHPQGKEPVQPEPEPEQGKQEAKDDWPLKQRVQRDDGLSTPVHEALKAAHQAGKPRPTAREVLAYFDGPSRPKAIVRVLADGCDYFDRHGNEKSADLQSIGKRIVELTTRERQRKSRN